MKYRRYNKDADNIILYWVNKSPDNLKHAFRCAAYIMGRTPKGVEQRYYNCLYNEDNSYEVTHYSNYSKVVCHKKETKAPLLKSLTEKFSISFGKFNLTISQR